ncbi:MAG TPA: hypothetical protein PKJ19_10085 [Flavobacteriales bacterium]|nr:hypothetical protein [Flavobacteriales bacterium]
MIDAIVDILNGYIALDVQEKHGLAQIVGGVPSVHRGDGQWTPLVEDSTGAWSYMRAMGQMSVGGADIGQPCSGMYASMTLRYAALLNRPDCDELPGALIGVAANIGSAGSEIKAAVGAIRVDIGTIRFGIDDVIGQEFSPTPTMPLDKVFVNIDIPVTIVGTAECIETCVAYTPSSSGPCPDCPECPECDPATIQTTDGGTDIAEVASGASYQLPQTSITYTDNTGHVGGITPVNTKYNSDDEVLEPDTVIPRFTVRTTDGSTPVQYGDIAAPSVNLPQTRIPYKDASDVSQVTDGGLTDYSSGSLIRTGEIPRRELVVNGVGTGQYVTLDRLIDGTVPALTSADLSSTFQWAIGHDTTLLFTVQTGDHAIGTYTAIADSGSNGTITVSKNGGAFAAFSSPLTLVVGDTIRFRRTTYSAAGWVRITGTYTP